MRKQRGCGITAPGVMEILDNCALPELEDVSPLGALIKPVIWSPCTSDIHICQTGAADLPYFVGKAAGHEMCGIVTYVGEEVQDFKVGDRVVVDAIMPRWRSMEAQDGHARLASDNLYWGIDYEDRGGTFVDEYYIRDADMNLAHVPDGVTWEQAVMTVDMMATPFAGLDALEMYYGDSIAVIGIGPVGLMAVRAAYLKGAGRLMVAGHRQNTKDLAVEFGATDVFDYHDEDYIDKMLEANGGPFDGVVLAGGGVENINKGLKLLKGGGTLLNLTAYFGVDTIPVDVALWGFGYGDKVIKAIPCDGGRRILTHLLALIQYGRVSPEKLVTHRFYGMDKIPDACQLFMDRDQTLIKPVIYNDGCDINT